MFLHEIIIQTVLLLLHQLQGTESSGVLTVRLAGFQNPSGRTYDGTCCDPVEQEDKTCMDECDYVMRLIVTGLGRANDHVFLFHRPLKYDSNNIEFEHNDNSLLLTVLFDRWPEDALVKMNAFFYDYDDYDHTTTLVDWFETDLKQSNTTTSAVWGHFQEQTVVGNRQLDKTLLTFDWSIMQPEEDLKWTLANEIELNKDTQQNESNKLKKSIILKQSSVNAATSPFKQNEKTRFHENNLIEDEDNISDEMSSDDTGLESHELSIEQLKTKDETSMNVEDITTDSDIKLMGNKFQSRMKDHKYMTGDRTIDEERDNEVDNNLTVKMKSTSSNVTMDRLNHVTAKHLYSMKSSESAYNNGRTIVHRTGRLLVDSNSTNSYDTSVTFKSKLVSRPSYKSNMDGDLKSDVSVRNSETRNGYLMNRQQEMTSSLEKTNDKISENVTTDLDKTFIQTGAVAHHNTTNGQTIVAAHHNTTKVPNYHLITTSSDEQPALPLFFVHLGESSSDYLTTEPHRTIQNLSFTSGLTTVSPYKPIGKSDHPSSFSTLQKLNISKNLVTNEVKHSDNNHNNERKSTVSIMKVEHLADRRESNTVDVAVSTNPVDVAVSTNPVDVAVSTNPVDVAISTNPVDVAVSTNPVDVAVSTNPVDVAISTNPVDVAISTNPVDVAISTNLVNRIQSTNVAIKPYMVDMTSLSKVRRVDTNDDMKRYVKESIFIASESTKSVQVPMQWYNAKKFQKSNSELLHHNIQVLKAVTLQTAAPVMWFVTAQRTFTHLDNQRPDLLYNKEEIASTPSLSVINYRTNKPSASQIDVDSVNYVSMSEVTQRSNLLKKTNNLVQQTSQKMEASGTDLNLLEPAAVTRNESKKNVINTLLTSSKMVSPSISQIVTSSNHSYVPDDIESISSMSLPIKVIISTELAGNKSIDFHQLGSNGRKRDTRVRNDYLFANIKNRDINDQIFSEETKSTSIDSLLKTTSTATNSILETTSNSSVSFMKILDSYPELTHKMNSTKNITANVDVDRYLEDFYTVKRPMDNFSFDVHPKLPPMVEIEQVRHSRGDNKQITKSDVDHNVNTLNHIVNTQDVNSFRSQVENNNVDTSDQRIANTIPNTFAASSDSRVLKINITLDENVNSNKYGDKSNEGDINSTASKRFPDINSKEIEQFPKAQEATNTDLHLLMNNEFVSNHKSTSTKNIKQLLGQVESKLKTELELKIETKLMTGSSTTHERDTMNPVTGYKTKVKEIKFYKTGLRKDYTGDGHDNMAPSVHYGILTSSPVSTALQTTSNDKEYMFDNRILSEGADKNDFNDNQRPTNWPIQRQHFSMKLDNSMLIGENIIDGNEISHQHLKSVESTNNIKDKYSSYNEITINNKYSSSKEHINDNDISIDDNKLLIKKGTIKNEMPLNQSIIKHSKKSNDKTGQSRIVYSTSENQYIGKISQGDNIEQDKRSNIHPSHVDETTSINPFHQILSTSQDITVTKSNLYFNDTSLKPQTNIDISTIVYKTSGDKNQAINETTRSPLIEPLSSTVFQYTSVPPSLNDAVIISYVQTSVSDNGVQTSVSDNDVQTSVSDNDVQTSVSDNDVQTSVSDNDVQTSVSDSDVQTSVSDSDVQTSVSDNDVQTSVSDNDVQISVSDNDVQTSVSDIVTGDPFDLMNLFKANIQLMSSHELEKRTYAGNKTTKTSGSKVKGGIKKGETNTTSQQNIFQQVKDQSSPNVDIFSSSPNSKNERVASRLSGFISHQTPTRENHRNIMDSNTEKRKQPQRNGDLERSTQQRLAYQQGKNQERLAYQQGTNQEILAYQQGTNQEILAYQQGTNQERLAYQQGTNQERLAYQQGTNQERLAYQQGTNQERLAYQQGTKQERSTNTYLHQYNNENITQLNLTQPLDKLNVQGEKITNFSESFNNQEKHRTKKVLKHSETQSPQTLIVQDEPPKEILRKMNNESKTEPTTYNNVNQGKFKETSKDLQRSEELTKPDDLEQQSTQKPDDLEQQSTQKPDDLQQSTQKPDDLEQSTQKPDDLQQSTQKSDDLEQSSQILDDIQQSTQKPDDLEQSTQKLDNLEQSTQKLDDIEQSTQKLDDLEQSTQKLDDLQQSTQKLDDLEQSTPTAVKLEKQLTTEPVKVETQSTLKPDEITELEQNSTSKQSELEKQLTTKPDELEEQSALKPIEIVKQSTLKPVKKNELVQQSIYATDEWNESDEQTQKQFEENVKNDSTHNSVFNFKMERESLVQKEHVIKHSHQVVSDGTTNTLPLSLDMVTTEMKTNEQVSEVKTDHQGISARNIKTESLPSILKPVLYVPPVKETKFIIEDRQPRKQILNTAMKPLPERNFQLHPVVQNTADIHQHQTLQELPTMTLSKTNNGIKKNIIHSQINLDKLRQYIQVIRFRPTVQVPNRGLYTPNHEVVDSTEIPAPVLPKTVERYGSTFQPLVGVSNVFTRYWPAVLGVSIGTIFLLTALITSLLCRQRRLLIQRARWLDSPQHLSEPPDPSEYATSSAASLTSDLTRSSINLMGSRHGSR